MIYKPFFYGFLPVGVLFFIFSLIQFFRKFSTHTDLAVLWLAIGILSFLVVWLSGMLRTHYSLALQDRLILTEFNIRYHKITGKYLENLKHDFTDKQIIALRFASDEELENLIQKTIIENLSPKEIKQQIKNWQADYRRV